jgi:hypothetical protein
MDLGHPTTEVAYVNLEILSVHGALEGSRNAQHSRGCPCIACISFFSHHKFKLWGSEVPTSRPVPLIVPARDQNDIPPQAICRRTRKVTAIQLDLLRVTHFSIFVTCHPVAGESLSTPVCMRLGTSTGCSSSCRNMRGNDVRYERNHSCGTRSKLTLERGRGSGLTHSASQGWGCETQFEIAPPLVFGTCCPNRFAGVCRIRRDGALMKTGCPVLFSGEACEGGSEGTVVCAVVYMSAREALLMKGTW